MTSLGNMCYCYNEECNQKEWERQGKTGKRQYTVISELWAPNLFLKITGKKIPVPKCPYCKKKMTVTASMDYSV